MIDEFAEHRLEAVLNPVYARARTSNVAQPKLVRAFGARTVRA